MGLEICLLSDINSTAPVRWMSHITILLAQERSNNILIITDRPGFIPGVDTEDLRTEAEVVVVMEEELGWSVRIHLFIILICF